VRLNEYYTRAVRQARSGLPTMREASLDYRRSLDAQLDAFRPLR
jgi:hypothetical protein